ncbi:MAG: chromosome segregation protein SMC [Selenomonadaceae bacterium]|nr:chromosome segregation protein SMC [Selenomonadaceae bacterium]
MQLKRLEIYGFKSFANKIEIEFDRGITGIVGPNGSGKSNIADAIRWSLGESNIRNIRGGQLSDVIFKGSKNKRSAGIAEVMIVFENDGEIDLNFKEISIQRRVFKTGESEFFINRTRCRLKDISELFADTGIGLGGISIITQTRVDEILKAKPEDRRIFFEETIGVTKYKNRKSETLNRMNDTDGNLIRAGDILAELETQLKPLAEQAKLTIKYNSLNEQRHRLRMIELDRKRRNFFEELNNQSQNLMSISENFTQLTTQLNIEEAKKERLHKENLDAEQKIFQQSESNEQIRQQLEKITNDISKLNERQSLGRNNYDQLIQRQKKLSSSLESAKKNLALLKRNLDEQHNEFQIKKSSLLATQKEFTELETLLKDQTKYQRECEQAISTLQQKLSAAKNEMLIIEHDLTAAEKNQRSITDDKSKLQAEIENLTQDQMSLTKLQESTTLEIEQISNSLNELKISLKAENDNSNNLQKNFDDLIKQRNSIESRLQILQRMQQNYEGFARAPKAILKSNEFWRKNIFGAVGELFIVPKKFATAIEIALGGNVQNIVTADEQTAKLAIEFLKREKLGRVTFLPLNRIVAPTNLFTVDAIGAIGFANSLIETENRFKLIADFLLSKTLIVDNFDNALLISKKYQVRIVTLDGELLNVGGSISGGSVKQSESNIFSRVGEIETLKTDLIAVNSKIDDLKSQLEISLMTINNLNTDIESKNKILNDLNVKSAENRAELNQIEKLIADKKIILNNLIDSVNKFETSISELHKRKKNNSDQIAAINFGFEKAQENFKRSKLELSKTEEQYKILSRQLNQLEIDCAIDEQKIFQLESQFNQLQNKISDDETQLKNFHVEEKTLLKNLSGDAVEIAKLNKEDELTRTRLAYGLELIKSLQESKLEILAAIAVSEKILRELNRKISMAKNQLHEIELTVSQLKILIADCEEKINSEFGIRNAEFKILEAEEILTAEEIAERINNLTVEIETIGAVNPNAPQEFEELNNRCEFLRKQLEDLQTAKKNLQVLVDEIDEKIISQFDSAFLKIQNFFAETFTKLFGGGKAQLELTNKDDILNTGVEIMVTLPQKKRQPLSMLSGGERALTVIALLFSFLKFKPSPFCILDEVDAPLDEANLIRFGGFLKEFSLNTQFIMITHRKTTMQFLDRIYGVTIDNDGVSKMLSIKLDE